ncbi:MAG TPA: cyclically-permuted mutarotase family protein [Bacteroidales bacterium]|nr:cyclically-permuted mutarotase family protein [Bacteroidales bacterium]HQB56652.1 cyclically-permuted mutarotase family protein [Bacteroidales bacterium]
MKRFLLLSAFHGLCVTCSYPQWEHGVSGFFAGKIGGTFVLAGGCNFPDVPAADKGKKVFYQDIFTLNGRRLGTLPEPVAYGVAVTYDRRLLCAGGSNENGSLNSVYGLKLTKAHPEITPMASLPVTMDNMSGAVCQNKWYLVGGNQDGVPSNQVFSLDLDNAQAVWQQEPSYPGPPRLQAVCVAQGGRLFLIGGFCPKLDSAPASVSLDALCFDPLSGQWTPVAAPVDEMGQPVSVGGGYGVPIGDSLLVVAGGVHKDIFLNALNGLYGTDYMKQSPEWYQLNPRLLQYDITRNQWTVLGSNKAWARAGAILVKKSERRLYWIHGELKPGIRTPDIQKIKI